MLFTNSTLEINKSISKIDGKEFRQLELFNIYGSRFFAQVEESMTDKILYVKDNVTHRLLDIDINEKGNLVFKNTKSDKLTIVLDMLDYKQFAKNSKIEVASESEVDFVKIRDFKLRNRLNTNWTVSLFDITEDGFGILKLTGTSGRTKYLIVKDKTAQILTFKAAKEFLKENGIDFEIESAKWNIL